LAKDVAEIFSGTIEVDETYLGGVWDEVVNDVEPDTLQLLIPRKVSSGSIVCFNTWKGYTGITAKRRIYHQTADY
jgi:hypothetical protein